MSLAKCCNKVLVWGQIPKYRIRPNKTTVAMAAAGVPCRARWCRGHCWGAQADERGQGDGVMLANGKGASGLKGTLTEWAWLSSGGWNLSSKRSMHVAAGLLQEADTQLKMAGC